MDLSAWWKFDGNTNDSSGNNLNGSNHYASLTTDKNGKRGSLTVSIIVISLSLIQIYLISRIPFDIYDKSFFNKLLTNNKEFLMKGADIQQITGQYHIRPNIKITGKLTFIFYHSGIAFSFNFECSIKNLMKWSHVVGTLSNCNFNLYTQRIFGFLSHF